MKMLYLPSGPLPSSAANAVHVCHMVDAFQLQDINVHIVSPHPRLHGRMTGEQLRAKYGLRVSPSIRHVWKPRCPGWGMIYRPLLAHLVRRSEARVVYGRTLQGCMVAAELSKPTVYEAHKPDWERTSTQASLDFKRLIHSPGFRGVICISEELNKYLLQAYPELRGRTVVVPDGAPAWPLPDEPDLSSPWAIGYFGSLYPGKGVETILEIAPLCPWAEFKIVGGTPDHVAWWRNRRPVPCNVSFLEMRDHADLPDLMKRCHVFLAPYLRRVQTHGGCGDISHWMSPLKIFEYMAMNRPLVASDLPVLREILQHGRNSLLAPAGDKEAWAAALEQLRDSPELARQLASKARSEYETKYTWDARAKSVLDALVSMAAIEEWR